MPGMAEPDIAIDIAPSVLGISGNSDTPTFVSGPRPRLVSLTLSLIGLDALVAGCAVGLCYALFMPATRVSISAAAIPLACLTICMSLSFFERGLYAAAQILSREVPWQKIAGAWLQAVAIGSLLSIGLATLSGSRSIAPGFGQFNTRFGAMVPALLVVGFAALTGARKLRLRFLADREPLNRTVIIGEQDPMHELLLHIGAGVGQSFDVIGVVELVSDTPARSSFGELPHFGDLAALERMIRQDAVDSVLVALPWSAGEQMRAIIQRISMAPVDVYIYPRMHGLRLPLRGPDRAHGLPLLMACSRPIGGWRACIKRAEDVVLSMGLMVFISPVILAIALAIKITSKGPIFFRQRRLGYNNRVIEVLKFRSMYTHLSDADANQQALRGDKRVTPVGAWLRKTSLDELPQLFNVLKGDMSLVGPRPHALATTAGGLALEEAVPVYASRHRVKPGITGWAQVNGYRGALDSVDKIVHRVNHDLYYIENWSLRLDLKILWRTARLVFADDNAF